MRWFKKLKPKKGVAHIMLYVTIFNGYESEGDKTTIKLIQAKMHKYADRMREFEDKRLAANATDMGNGLFINFGFRTLQQVSVDWDMDSNELELLATGGGLFNWKGTLDQFLKMPDSQLLAA